MILICHKDIKIGNAWDLYNTLNGNAILNKYIDKSKQKENQIGDDFEQKEIKLKNKVEIKKEEGQIDERKVVKQEEKNLDEEDNEEGEEEEDDVPRGDY